MQDFDQFFLTLGLLFLVGLMTDLVGRHTFLPRVSLLMLFGFAIGPSALDIIPDIGHRWFPTVADMALVMIGFLLGGKLTKAFFKHSGRHVVLISLAETLTTTSLVAIGMLLLGQPLAVALLLGAIAPATAPAATIAIVRENTAKGHFTDILLGVVSIDDIWGISMFTLSLSLVIAFSGAQGSTEVLLSGAWDVGGAVLLGVGLGIPMAYLTGRVRAGEPTLVEALGFVFLCAGIAFWLDVSFLLAAMVMGAVVSNLGKHHSRPFHAIEGIEWPFLTLFFVLSGASLEIDAFTGAGAALGLYVLLRILGKFCGCRLGAACSRADQTVRSSLWMGLMPQAGVALGMALYASQRFPEYGEVIMPVVISATILFELFGPIMTRQALIASGDAAKHNTD